MAGIHPSWIKTGGVALEIMQGMHDDAIEAISDACRARVKTMFRKNQRVKLTGTRNVELDGALARIEKVNAKSISIRLDSGPVYNVPPRMLEVI